MAAIGSESVMSAFAKADSPAEIARIAKSLGFNWCFWQCWHPEEVATWDGMPKGFLEHYYGIEADRFCPVAVAVRRRWQSYTFKEARDMLGRGAFAIDANKVWEAFGIRDGAVIFGGRGPKTSALILAADKPVEAIFLRHRAALQTAAVRMDELLQDHPGLNRITREFTKLSERQLDVLRVQIDHPEMTLAEQANLLGISPRMLDKRHQQIAKRFGVTSFTAAVAKAMAEGTELD